MKQCYACKIDKNDSSFPDGRNRCNDCFKQYRKEYNAKNKNKILKQQKEYYKNNKNEVLVYQKEYYHSINGKINSIYNGSKRRAEKKNIPFDLTKEWIIEKLELQNYQCALTNIKLDFNENDNYINPYMPSLDRIDSKKGYTIDNVRIVCVIINLSLNEFGESVFKTVCEAYINNYKQ